MRYKSRPRHRPVHGLAGDLHLVVRIQQALVRACEGEGADGEVHRRETEHPYTVLAPRQRDAVLQCIIEMSLCFLDELVHYVPRLVAIDGILQRCGVDPSVPA